jgi:hypothetical protein
VSIAEESGEEKESGESGEEKESRNRLKQYDYPRYVRKKISFRKSVVPQQPACIPISLLSHSSISFSPSPLFYILVFLDKTNTHKIPRRLLDTSLEVPAFLECLLILEMYSQKKYQKKKSKGFPLWLYIVICCDLLCDL